MTYSCAIWSRGAETLEEAQETKLELVCTKLGAARRATACSTSAAAGARSPSTRPSDHGAHVTGITLSEPQAEGARQPRAGGGRRRPRRHPRAGLPRAAPASASTRSRRSAWSSTSARPTSTPTRRRWRTCSGPAAGCSTTASRGCATARPRPARSPSATCSPTPRRCTSRASQFALERAGFETRARRGLPARLRAHAARVDAPARGQPRRGGAAGRRRADARLAGLPAGRPPRLRDRLHVDLPGACREGVGTDGCGGTRRDGVPTIAIETVRPRTTGSSSTASRSMHGRQRRTTAGTGAAVDVDHI